MCTIMMASATTIIISTADLGQFTIRQQNAIEQEARWQYTEDAIKAVYTHLQASKALVLPSTTTLTVNGMTASVLAEAGTGARSRFVSLTTTVADRKLSRTRVSYIGMRGAVSPMWFGYSTGSSTTLSNDIDCDTDVYLTGDITGTGLLSVDGDLYTAQSTFTVAPTVGGTTYPLSPTFYPVVNIGDYQAAATIALSGTQNVTLLLFASLGAYQTLWYNNGSVTFDVKYAGKGTCVVNGNATIKKFDRNSSTDQGLILVNGNVDIQTNKVQGFIFCTGNVTYSGAGNLQIDGAIFCNNLIMGGKKLSITFDPFFWDNPTFDKRMRVPGMW